MKSKLQNKSLKILFVISLSLLTSCAVVVPDFPVCTEINPSRGYCVNTISAKEYEVNNTNKLNGQTWWEIRPQMIYLPVSSWVEIKKFVIKICKKSKRCSGKNVAGWQRTVEKIDTKVVPD